MNIPVIRWLSVPLTVVFVLSLPAIVSAQQMNFSYYGDTVMSEDNQTLYTIIDGYDNSSGCSHWDHQATGYVNGPSGYFEQNFPSLSTYIGVPAYEGNYSFSSNVVVNCSCFGSGLGAGGGYGSQTVTHPIPTGEFSSFNGWDGGIQSAARFSGVLQGTGSFNGRQVREQAGGGDVDTCHFQGSALPPASGVTGGTWTVNNVNIYGNDVVGWVPTAVAYYRNAGRAPCQSETNQNMEINRPGSTWVHYKTNRLKMGFTATTVWSERDGNHQSKAY